MAYINYDTCSILFIFLTIPQKIKMIKTCFWVFLLLLICYLSLCCVRQARRAWEKKESQKKRKMKLVGVFCTQIAKRHCISVLEAEPIHSLQFENAGDMPHNNFWLHTVMLARATDHQSWMFLEVIQQSPSMSGETETQKGKWVAYNLSHGSR